MRRRVRADPLQPNPAVTWLVVHNRLSEVVESQEIEPRTDLRAVLAAARDARIAAGWLADELGDRLFCSRGDERVLVGIEFREPPACGKIW